MKLRRYHRWLATIIGIFVLWTATTGVTTQVARIYSQNQPRPGASAAPASASAAAEAPRPPEGQAQSPARKFVKFVTDLHSGERFGLVGQLVSLVTGLAILFLAGSGLWMYIRMFRARATKERTPSSKWFWK